MSTNIVGIRDAVLSHALSLGYFDRVDAHEPKNSPGKGLHASVFLKSLMPVRSSGLASTSAVMVFTVRIERDMIASPEDEIDIDVLMAADALFVAYSGDFELGGLIREVDLLGAYGTPLSLESGYLKQDSTLYRVLVITLPLVINDVWSQVA